MLLNFYKHKSKLHLLIMKIGILFFYIIFLINYTFCQGIESKIGLNGSKMQGYSFAPNNVYKTGLSLNGTVYGFDIGITKQVNGKKQWQKDLGNPRFGLNVQTILMNKPDTFGFNVSLLPWVQIPLIKYNKGEIVGKIGIGLAYASEAFNRKKNFDNRAVSSPINFALEFGLVLNQMLTKKIDFNAELGYYHLSNGSFRIPNGGFNIYFIKTGLSYFISGNPYANRIKINKKIEHKKIYYSAFTAFGYREFGTFALIHQFPVFTIHQALYKPINKLYNLGIGFDLFYDATNALRVNENLMVSDVPEADKILLAVGICNEFTFGKLALPLEIYNYFSFVKRIENKNYLRFGLTYYANKKMFFGCYFKGSIANSKSLESDFMEFAIGYKFRK